MRTVTSTVRVENREDTMVSVKTAAPIPKEVIFTVMARIRAARVNAPVKIGDVILFSEHRLWQQKISHKFFIHSKGCF